MLIVATAFGYAERTHSAWTNCLTPPYITPLILQMFPLFDRTPTLPSYYKCFLTIQIIYLIKQDPSWDVDAVPRLESFRDLKQ